MATLDIDLPVQPTQAQPVVRPIKPSDLKEVLAKGLDDFLAMPTHVAFLCVVYPIAGLLLARASFGYDVVPMLYPLASGFALIGPFAAIGLYELSRRRELGRDTSWRHAFDVLHSPSLPAILALGALLLAIFVIWIFCAQSIYAATVGQLFPADAAAFAQAVVSTPEGYRLMLVGNAVGFVFALVAGAISAISFPLLLDRNIGFATAVLTSLRVVLKNPLAMAAWGLIVAGLLILGSLPLFMGLIVVMPILGHATWHLFRRVIERDPGQRPEYQPRPAKGERYAAEFPSSLFFPSRRDE